MSNLKPKLIWKECLGTGAFGTVYRAHDPYFKRDIAVKCLKKSTQALETVQSEKNALLTLTQNQLSKHIIALYAYGQDKKYFYFEMELVNGETLAQKILSSNYMTFGRIQFYTAQLVVGIDFIHQAGIIHHDLKPDNIMITHYEEVKIGDFGLAKKLQPGVLCHDQSGTRGYIAPEIYDHNEHSYSADWYALGITIFQMCIRSLSLDFLDYRKHGLKYLNLDRSIADCFYQGILNPQTKRIILGLTCPDPIQRAEYARQLHQRSFFSNINWNNI